MACQRYSTPWPWRPWPATFLQHISTEAHVNHLPGCTRRKFCSTKTQLNRFESFRNVTFLSHDWDPFWIGAALELPPCLLYTLLLLHPDPKGLSISLKHARQTVRRQHPAMRTWQDHHHRDTCHDLSQSLISTRPAKPPILERHRATRLQTAFFASCCLAEYVQRFFLRTSCGITIEKQKYKVLILLHFAPFQIHWWQDNKTIVVYRKFIEHLGHISTPYFSSSGRFLIHEHFLNNK